MTQLKNVRIFIPFPFQDKRAERDHMVKVVFPELREHCAKRQLHLIDVDLRWGVKQKNNSKAKYLGLLNRLNSHAYSLLEFWENANGLKAGLKKQILPIFLDKLNHIEPLRSKSSIMWLITVIY